ncbi:MAG: hypothetical protein J6X84_00925 [Treponema sp.]|nr:hypothetical protein [Treponema sp.]
MKKHKFWRLSAAAISVILLGFTSLFAGCKSAPAGRPVDPLELIDNNSAFYLAVPKAADSVLIERIICSVGEDISESDAKIISGHINKIYCGLNRSRYGTELQAAIDGNIPRSFLPKILNNKNGWKISDYVPKNSISVYKVYSGDIDMSFPSSKIACIGRDIDVMLDKYDSLVNLPYDNANELYTDLDDELIAYLKGAETEIRFFANKPQSFLTILTGTQLDLKLIDVKGSFKTDPKFDSQYLLDLSFRFKNVTYLKAGRALLNIAFGLTNSDDEIIGDNELLIHNIRIDKKQLYQLLLL